MTERDAFEIRLAAALRALRRGRADRGRPGRARPAVAASEPRRHGLAAALGGAGSRSRALAWVLLLLAALLAALVAGMLVVGSQPQRKLPAVVPPVGRVRLSARVDARRAGAGRPGPAARDSASAMAFDRRRRQAGAVAGITTTGVETWTFDVCTNTWTQMHPEPGAAKPRMDGRLVYDVDSDVTIAGLRSGEGVGLRPRGRHLDREGGRSDRRDGSGPTTRSPASSSPRATPSRGRCGPTTSRRTRGPRSARRTGRARRHAAVLAYDASVDRMVAYTGGDAGPETWLLDIRTGTWSRSGAEHAASSLGMWAAARHRLRRGGGADGGLRQRPMAAYDATADRWETCSSSHAWVDRGRPDWCTTR